MKHWHVASLVGLAVMLASCSSGSTADPDAKVAAPAASAVTTTSKPALAPPRTTDFKLTVKTTKKDCFGTAGCNLIYHIDVAVKAAGDPGTEYRVTYEVKGVEDGPKINTFLYQDGKYVRDDEEIASTKTSSAKLTAVVTEVIEN
jgi:hypothetical protein